MTPEVIAGIDEAGRGALAGPVVAGACIINLPLFRRRRMGWSPFKRKPENDCIIADSKMLTPMERESAYAWITQHCIYGAGIVSADFIESHGILAATNRAMCLALEEVMKTITPSSLLIDGRDAFRFPLPHRSIIRGDSIEPSIAAASIVAKVTRDRLISDARHEYPNYGFEKHKGYGSDDHISAIRLHGPCPLHRLSFLTRILAPEQETMLFSDS